MIEFAGYKMPIHYKSGIINEHKNVAESAIVGFPHEIKGNALYGFVTLKNSLSNSKSIYALASKSSAISLTSWLGNNI